MPSCPGRSSLWPALVQKTAQLPQIDLSAPAPASVLGKNTASCLQNGFVLGTAGLLDGLADRFRAELGPEAKFYATGSLPRSIREACRTPIHLPGNSHHRRPVPASGCGTGKAETCRTVLFAFFQRHVLYYIALADRQCKLCDRSSAG